MVSFRLVMFFSEKNQGLGVEPASAADFCGGNDFRFFGDREVKRWEIKVILGEWI